MNNLVAQILMTFFHASTFFTYIALTHPTYHIHVYEFSLITATVTLVHSN